MKAKLTLPLADELIRLVDRWRRCRIVVAGDFMLDRYVYGNADRLSPDAPVPVLTVERETWTPGGASNVCMDLAALNCDVECLGLMGDDEAASRLAGALEDSGCRTTGLIRDRGRPTTIKQNFVGLAQARHAQKMFRVDIEDRRPIDDHAAKKLLAKAEKLLPKAGALCIEDYNKGVLTEPVCKALIAMARKAKVPVLVDPAAISDYGKYEGATTITPNRTEAAKATGLSPDQPEAMARKLLRQLKLETVVVTLDKHGALLLQRDGGALAAPTQARAVYDVTGAGDMVLAMLAAAKGNGASWPAAVALANVAAGLEVERFGVVPIKLAEVLLALLDKQHEQLGKVRTLEQLATEVHAHRTQGRRIVFTNGCFDILHAGHVAYLRSARRMGDLMIVAVNSDDSIRRLKGPTRPVNHQADRLLVLSELQCIDYLMVFDDDTPEGLIEALRPDVLVKGGDYREDQVVGAKFVKSYGGKVALVPLVEGRSTTNIVRRIKAEKREG
ncbi:MAG: D-glycero-beta-D-manno-heptose 1-phosphate adenylyltransferase [Phycisphaeraceae bacterium]|nr:D-glycero-beta-D-manno-heptose 1-phosphate adenylyltransferase [Phycisphaeraceae bacterium]